MDSLSHHLKKELPTEPQSQALMSALFRQLSKDLNIDKIEAQVGDSLRFSVLHAWLTNYIEVQVQRNAEGFFNSLYTIDIEDKMLKAVLGGDSPYEGLSQLIILRELYKVKMRENFKHRSQE